MIKTAVTFRSLLLLALVVPLLMGPVWPRRPGAADPLLFTTDFDAASCDLDMDPGLALTEQNVNCQYTFAPLAGTQSLFCIDAGPNCLFIAEDLWAGSSSGLLVFDFLFRYSYGASSALQLEVLTPRIEGLIDTDCDIGFGIIIEANDINVQACDDTQGTAYTIGTTCGGASVCRVRFTYDIDTDVGTLFIGNNTTNWESLTQRATVDGAGGPASIDGFGMRVRRKDSEVTMDDLSICTEVPTTGKCS